MKNQYLEIVKTLKKLPYIEPKSVRDLELFMQSTTAYTREENPDEHICAFFIPVVKDKRMVFVGHHKKADDWIPPGGHVDKGEVPLQTVIREMEEELQYKITDEEVVLFDCANKSIMKPHTPCKRHYDLVYVVYLPELVDFTYDPGEFYDAKWLSFEEAAAKTTTAAFKPMMEHVRDLV